MLGSLMEAEIREQPLVLKENLNRYQQVLGDAVGGRSFDLVVIAARGSSDHAAIYLRYLVEIHLGIPVSLAAPSVVTKYGTQIRYQNALGIGISQSGSGPDVAGFLEAMRGHGNMTLAITNTAGSRLASSADASLTLDAGLERSVAATKTYSASLLAAYQLVRAMGGDLPEAELPTDAWVGTCEEQAAASLGPVLRSSILIALARGYNYCTALETSLKMMECALLPCKGYSTADFEHGPKALAGHGSAAIVYGELMSDLAALGCIPIHAPAWPDTPCSPVAIVIFGQWMALLAARARGLDPDNPRALSKVTQTL